jgi:hypothetical protein
VPLFKLRRNLPVLQMLRPNNLSVQLYPRFPFTSARKKKIPTLEFENGDFFHLPKWRISRTMLIRARITESRLVVVIVVLVFHVNCHAHPGMYAALKTMFALRQAVNLQLAALQDARPGDGEVFEAAGAFGDRGLAAVKVADEAAPELLNPSEGVRLAALVDSAAPSIWAEGFDVFVLGDGDGLEHGLGEIGEGGGDFGFDIAAGDGAEEARHGSAEIASGEQFYRRKREMSSPTCWVARDSASF